MMLDGTKGEASLFDDEYRITFNGDVFDSNYLRITGVSTGNLNTTVKGEQGIWPEWTGDDTAEDIQDNRYINEDGQWYYETDDLQVAEEDDNAA